jgi:hypothetical protein
VFKAGMTLSGERLQGSKGSQGGASPSSPFTGVFDWFDGTMRCPPAQMFIYLLIYLNVFPYLHLPSRVDDFSCVDSLAVPTAANAANAAEIADIWKRVMAIPEDFPIEAMTGNDVDVFWGYRSTMPQIPCIFPGTEIFQA